MPNAGSTNLQNALRASRHARFRWGFASFWLIYSLALLAGLTLVGWWSL